MTSYFDDTQSQSTNSNSPNFNSFSSSSRIWSSSITAGNTNTTTTSDATSPAKQNKYNHTFDSADVLSASNANTADTNEISGNGNLTVDDYYDLLNTDDAPPLASWGFNTLTNASTSTSTAARSNRNFNVNNLSSNFTQTVSTSHSDSFSLPAKKNNNSYGQGYRNMQQHHQHPYNDTSQQQQMMHPSHAQINQQRNTNNNSNNNNRPTGTASHVQNAFHSDDITGTMQGMHLDTSRTNTNIRSTTAMYTNTMHHAHAGYNTIDPLENLLGPFLSVRLRNLPYDANIEDVLLFFQGLVMLDVIILPPPIFHGHHHQVQSSEAFVLFGNPADFQMAFQRHRQQMRHGGSYVDVFQGKRNDYYAAVSSQFMHFQQRQSEENHRSASPYAPNNIPAQALMGNTNTSAPINEQQLHQQHMNMNMHQGQLESAPISGPRPRSSRSDSRGKAPGRGTSRGGGIQIGEHTGYLRMRGLPFTTMKDEIFEFLVGYEPIEDSICLTYRSDGRATGEGYVAFPSPEHGERAMDLHKKSLGSRYIELFISNKEEHGRAKAREPTSDSGSTSDQHDA